MTTSISRRVIFVKLKRRRMQQKPKQKLQLQPPSRPAGAGGDVMVEDEPMVGEAMKPAMPRLAHADLPAPRRGIPWKIAGWWAAAALMLGIVILAAVKSGTTGRTLSVETTRAPAPTSLPHASRSGTSRGYGGYPGASDAPGSGGVPATAPAAPTVEGFLAAPFSKRGTCVVQADAGKESVMDFRKCLEESRENLSKKGP